MKKLSFIGVLVFMVFILSPLHAKEISPEAWKKLRRLHANATNQKNNEDKPEVTINWIEKHMLEWVDDKENKEKLKEDKEKLEKAKEKLDKDLKRCETERNIAYFLIAAILGSFIAFILIKKCQAKKVPRAITNATEQTK